MTKHYKIKGNTQIYKTKSAIVRDLCVSFKWVNSMIESGKITVIEVTPKKPEPKNTKHQLFYFQDNYGSFKSYHCTIDEYVDIKGISKNKMYSMIKSGLISKSKSENIYSKSKVSPRARKRALNQYVLACAEKGVPVEIDI